MQPQAKLLDEAGLDVVILDNLSTGRRENLRWGAFIEGDIADTGLVRSLKLLDAMVGDDERQFVFASSSSVYGDTVSVSAHEDAPVIPVSAYGESKLQTERVLPWYERAYGLRWAALLLGWTPVASGPTNIVASVVSSCKVKPRP